MEALTKRLQQAVTTKQIHGVSYALLTPTKTDLGYLGMQGGEQKIAIAPQMQYDLASLTKVVATTTRILQLLAKQKLSLEDEIGNYVFDLAAPHIKIKDLLLHTSGLPADLANYHNLSRLELITAIKNTMPQAKMKKSVCYSDLGFILLGWVIATIDGDLDESIIKNVCTPLKMASTQYKPQLTLNVVLTEYQAKRGGLIRAVVHDGKAYRLGGVSGHAGLFSTLEDLTNFMHMYLQNGIFQQRQILSPEIFTLLKDQCFETRTLGWQVWQNQPTKLWHTGFTGPVLALDLQRKRGVICLTNRICPTRKNTEWIQTRQEILTEFFE